MGDNKIIYLNLLPLMLIQVDTSIPDPALTNTSSHIISSLENSHQGMLQGDKAVIHLNPLPPTPVQDTSSPDLALTQMQQFQATLF